MNKPSPRLITVIRIRRPERSLVDPDFSERRKHASANESGSEPFKRCDDPSYGDYLRLLEKEIPNIVKAANAPATKILLNPDWLGVSLFKTAGSVDPVLSWLPFMTAVRLQTGQGT